jgi:predicted permease
MSWLRRLLRTSAAKEKIYGEIDKELTFHIEELTKENIAAGMSPEEARRRALIEFGGERQVAEETRRKRGIPWLDDFIHDLRFAGRLLLKSPGYTFAAILALSIGIGPNTAFFTLFDAIFFRPAPFPLPDEVVAIEKAVPGQRFNIMDFSYAEYQYYRDHNMTLDALAVVASPDELILSDELGGAAPLFGLIVSSNYFSVMGITAAAGNTFNAADDVQTAPPYSAMLSDNFWERRFGRDPEILGKRITLGNVPVTIIGIIPRDFMGSGPRVPSVWLPLGARSERSCCRLEGRLKAGITREQSQAELTRLADAFYADLPERDPQWTITLVTPTPGFARNSTLYREPHRTFILFSMFQAAIGMVLLIACANVSGLLLGKAVSRQKEIAVRLSLGASRARLIRQLLTESFLISLAAGVLGLLTSWWVTRVLVLMATSAISRMSGGSFVLNLTPDLNILLYAFGISVITAVAFSLSPALQATRLNLTESLNDEVPAFGGLRKFDFRGTVSAQVAVCLMLLIGAATIVGSAAPLLSSDLGFDPERMLVVSAPTPEQSRELQERVAGLPDIASIASASEIPLNGARAPTFVGPAYFETLGISLLQGRTFSRQEISTHAPVAVVSSAIAAKQWPGENAIGKVLSLKSPVEASFQVIGVVRDVSNSAVSASYLGTVYIPSQRDGLEDNVFIRTMRDSSLLAAHLYRELPSMRVRTMTSVVNEHPALMGVQALGTTFSMIGVLGLLLASIGIYSMVGYAVSRQSREIGIRMALGAQRTDVRRMILGRSMRPIGQGIAAGLVLGVIVSLMMSRIFQSLKFLDVRALAAISVLIIVISLVAAYIPARSATNLDPLAVLRKQ